MIDHVAAFFRREQEETRYRAYVTDSLKAIAENTMHNLIPGIGNVDYGACMSGRWYNDQKPEDNRTGDEIAEEIILRAGLTLKGGDE